MTPADPAQSEPQETRENVADYLLDRVEGLTDDEREAAIAVLAVAGQEVRRDVYRVVQKAPGKRSMIVTQCTVRANAEERLRLEAEDYPGHAFWIETRTVSPWSRASSPSTQEPQVDSSLFRQCEDSGHPPTEDGHCHCGYVSRPATQGLAEALEARAEEHRKAAARERGDTRGDRLAREGDLIASTFHTAAQMARDSSPTTGEG